MAIFELETERLNLRQWQDDDFAIFAQMNADPEVMRYFPKLLSSSTSNVIAAKCQQLIEQNGWGLWAVSLKSAASLKTNHSFIGFVGLNDTHTDLPFAPNIEIAWRLHKKYWGYGYATEAAHASLKFAFEQHKLSEVVSFTAVTNQRSQHVMQRIGMIEMPDHFYHPMLERNHPLAEQILYKMTFEQWQQQTINL